MARRRHSWLHHGQDSRARLGRDICILAVCILDTATPTTNKRVEMSEQEQHASLGSAILSTDAAMDVRLCSTYDEVLLLCLGTMLLCTRAKMQGGRRVSWTLAGRAHRQPCLLHRLESATLVGMRWQDYVTWDLVTSR
jgi:hypothetical protein